MGFVALYVRRMSITQCTYLGTCSLQWTKDIASAIPHARMIFTTDGSGHVVVIRAATPGLGNQQGLSHGWPYKWWTRVNGAPKHRAEYWVECFGLRAFGENLWHCQARSYDVSPDVVEIWAPIPASPDGLSMFSRSRQITDTGSWAEILPENGVCRGGGCLLDCLG
jgi:hypothetical protein